MKSILDQRKQMINKGFVFTNRGTVATYKRTSLGNNPINIMPPHEFTIFLLLLVISLCELNVDGNSVGVFRHNINEGYRYKHQSFYVCILL